MPSSKDPIINRQKAKEYRLAHPEWHRRTNREWAARKRARQTLDERNAAHRRMRERDPVGYLVRHAKRRARKLNVPFDLSREDLAMPEVCPVMGTPWQFGDGKMGWRNMRAPSLDRIKPHLGYVRGNVEIISTRANHLKSNGSIAEMRAVLAYMERVGAYKTYDEALYAIGVRQHKAWEASNDLFKFRIEAASGGFG